MKVSGFLRSRAVLGSAIGLTTFLASPALGATGRVGQVGRAEHRRAVARLRQPWRWRSWGGPHPASARVSLQRASHEHLILDEEFNGPAGLAPDPRLWNFDAGGNGWGNGELESNTGRTLNAALDGSGDLAIVARRESYTGADGITRAFTSARLQTLGKFQFRYGRVEARIQVPEGQGLVAQFWALGAEGYRREHAWPGCGEIDMMEVLGSRPSVVAGHLHGPWPSEPNQGIGARSSSPVALSEGFHTFGAQWQPGRVTLTRDGSPYATLTPADLPALAPWPFGHPFFLVLDLAVGGEWPGAPTETTPFPARMLVDWVKVWQ